MTNEELAVAVAQGRDDLQLQLWEQVCSFVQLMARRAIILSGGGGGVTTEDLTQQGYIAMMQAVKAYDPERGPFLHYLSFALRQAFADAGGYRTSKSDPLNDCNSLDTLIAAGEDSEETYLDMIADPCDQYGEVEQQIYTEQLHGVLDRAIDGLTPKHADILRALYWRGKTNTEIAAGRDVSVQNVGAAVRRGIDDLRRSRFTRELLQFLDERTDFYGGTGCRSFEASGSSVERAVIRRDGLRKRWERNREDAV